MIDLYRIRDRLEEWWRYPQPSRAQKQLLGQYTDVIDTEFTAVRLASEESAQYVLQHMRAVPNFDTDYDLHKWITTTQLDTDLLSRGTVLEFGGEQEVTLGTDGSNRVAGVVSTNPAYAMNAQCAGEFPVAIALQGRVPVKVRGNVRKGDMIVSGGNGYARPSSAPLMGTVIGKSLENFSGTDGIIEIAVGRL